MSQLSILGVTIDPITESEAIIRIADAAKRHQKFSVATINPEFIMAAQQDSKFRNVLNQSDLKLADGIGALWAANLLAYRPRISGKQIKLINIWIIAAWYGIKTFLSVKFRTDNIPQQVSGSDLSISLARYAEQQSLSLFLLGERDGVGQKAAAALQTQFPKLVITGTFPGNGAAAGDEECRKILQDHPADIVLVAYGAPKQEFWISRNLPHIPMSVAIGVGGTFRFLAGDIRRAPGWVRRIGLEWLFRLILEPWRWRRQLALPKFVFATIKAKSCQPV
jgi:N-acetylglucosaminyldiphosphoundecaprenol N-acetyl-beta-D-mannosaminyltransferase